MPRFSGTIALTSLSAAGGAIPRRVFVPRQYRPLRTQRRSPLPASRWKACSTALGELLKSAGRQKRSGDDVTLSRTIEATPGLRPGIRSSSHVNFTIREPDISCPIFPAQSLKQPCETPAPRGRLAVERKPTRRHLVPAPAVTGSRRGDSDCAAQMTTSPGNEACRSDKKMVAA